MLRVLSCLARGEEAVVRSHYGSTQAVRHTKSWTRTNATKSPPRQTRAPQCCQGKCDPRLASWQNHGHLRWGHASQVCGQALNPKVAPPKELFAAKETPPSTFLHTPVGHGGHVRHLHDDCDATCSSRSVAASSPPVQPHVWRPQTWAMGTHQGAIVLVRPAPSARAHDSCSCCQFH